MACLWYDTVPLAGRCGIAERDGRIVRVFLADGGFAPELPVIRTELLDEAARQLREYFAGQRRRFDLPLDPAGTPFQRQVWDKLRDVPYGETVPYGELAASLGRPGSARAVGQAVGANPIPFIIPCHRVVGSDGSMTGYALGVALKRRLLEMERGSNVC